MGELILNLVIETLAQAGFTVREAFPGQTVGSISGPVAAVELSKVDGPERRVTAAVHILCTAAQGGTACERAALNAGRALEEVGAECTQSGCDYDGVARVYRVTLEAKFLLGAREVINGPGFQVWLDEEPMPWVVSFRGERIRKQEQRIPQDCVKPELPEGEFVLRVLCGDSHEVYSGCSCASILREYTREGLKQVVKGMCRTRTVTIGG